MQLLVLNKVGNVRAANVPDRGVGILFMIFANPVGQEVSESAALDLIKTN